MPEFNWNNKWVYCDVHDTVVYTAIVIGLSFDCTNQSDRIAGLTSLSIPLLYLLLTCLYQILNPCCCNRRTRKRLLLTWILAFVTLALKIVTILGNIYIFNEIGLLDSIKHCRYNYGPISSVIFSYFMMVCIFPMCTACSKHLLWNSNTIL